MPFAITVDYDTVQAGERKDTVTLRERDSTEQVRVPIGDLVAVLKGLCDPQAELDWAAMKSKYPVQAPPADGKE